MKKLFFTLLTLCLCGATYAQDITDSNGCTYSSVTGSYSAENPVELTDGKSATGAVVIPSTVENGGTNYTVVGIAQDAFTNNTGLTSITIPYTVTYIGTTANTNGAFRACTGLTSVTFDESSSNASELESLGNYAFYECSSLASIKLPALLTTLGDDAFMDCSALTSIELPEKVTSLGGSLFRNCTALTEAKLPERLTVINSSCFRACTALTTVWMSGSATIYSDAFANCPNLSAFVLEGSEPLTSGGTESGSDPFDRDDDDVITLYVPTGSAPAYLKTAWATDVTSSTQTGTLSWNFNSISILYDSNDEDNVYYATYYTDAMGEFGEDITANIVTEAGESGEITYQPVTGVIPAGTGLLLTAKSEEALEESIDTYYYHPYGVTEATASFDGNMLYGVEGGGMITEPENCYYYMLSLDSSSTAGSIGFYWGAGNGGAFTSGAGKAYLAVPISSDGDAVPTHYSFKKDEGDTTGISAVESASEKAVSGIYTIQGVRVSNMNQPGLYIVDGKKVLVK